MTRRSCEGQIPGSGPQSASMAGQRPALRSLRMVEAVGGGEAGNLPFRGGFHLGSLGGSGAAGSGSRHPPGDFINLPDRKIEGLKPPRSSVVWRVTRPSCHPITFTGRQGCRRYEKRERTSRFLPQFAIKSTSALGAAMSTTSSPFMVKSMRSGMPSLWRIMNSESSSSM